MELLCRNCISPNVIFHLNFLFSLSNPNYCLVAGGLGVGIGWVLIILVAGRDQSKAIFRRALCKFFPFPSYRLKIVGSARLGFAVRSEPSSFAPLLLTKHRLNSVKKIGSHHPLMITTETPFARKYVLFFGRGVGGGGGVNCARLIGWRSFDVRLMAGIKLPSSHYFGIPSGREDAPTGQQHY